MEKLERPHWSFSSINQFLRICPMQFAFQRLFRIQPEFVSESLPFGSAIHRTAEFLWANRMSGKDVTPDQLADLFGEIWKREVADTPNLQYQKGDFESLLQQGQEMVREYRRQFPDDLQIVGYNVPFLVPLIDRHGEILEKPLTGEIDLLVRHGDRLCAVDLKTAAQRYTETKMATDLQPTVYLYALTNMQALDCFFRWDVLLKTKTAAFVQYPVERTVEDFHRLVDLIKAAQALIDSGNLIPSEGSHFCPGCGFQEACRDWSFESKPAVPAPRPQLMTA